MLSFVTTVTEPLMVRWSHKKMCWACRMGDIVTYGSIASAVGLAFLSVLGADYMRGRVLLLEQETEEKQ